MDQAHWQQRAKINWIAKGDRNAKFFHTSVKLKRHYNRISAFKDDNGNWNTNLDDIQNLVKDLIVQHYSNEKTQGSILNDSMEFIRQANLPKLSTEQSASLYNPITKMEIETAVFQMDANKAPGPDGFPPPSSNKCGGSSRMIFMAWLSPFLIGDTF